MNKTTLGTAYLGPLLFVLPAGAISPLGLAEKGVPLPFGGPSCFQVWAQGVTFDPVTGNLELTAPQPEPAWIF